MNTQNYNFQKLNPIRNVELNVYKDALDFVFEDKDIKNVAISGSYGAGKSSVIETYKNTHENIQFLHISLAHFKSTSTKLKVDEENEEENKKSESVPVLEGKILNQLIHQIDPKKIPQTNFKIKQKVSRKKVAATTTLLTFFVILISYLFHFDNWVNWIFSNRSLSIKNGLEWTADSFNLLLFSGGIVLIIFSIAVFKLIIMLKNKNIFRKFSFQGNDIEIFEDSKDSFFDKYLNEVLYLFDKSGADVIVFEDIDRYKVNQIFERLREVNTLVNYQRTKEDKKTLRFFYLLRDDIFVSKDRTKFFDFIIPIVPVIDGSNSYDQFISHFEEGTIFELFDEGFLHGIFLYVDDMRILKNIYNEFIMYHKRIKSTELELRNNKLLAMVIYKNIFPRDFSDLQLGRGFVHTLFESKASFIYNTIKIYNERIQSIEEQLQTTEAELLNSLDELDAVFLLGNHHIRSVGGINISTFKTRAQLMKAIRENQTITLASGQNYIISTELEKLLENKDYLKRKTIIERKTKDQLETLKTKLQKLKQKRLTVEMYNLKEIITKENIEEIFKVNFINEIGKKNTFNEIKSSPYFDMIKYLIRNGFIDETYPDYMTYFYGKSISRIDKIFLRSVTDQQEKDFSYELDNPQEVLSRLRLVDFDHEEILNFDLLCHLLTTKKTNQAYLSRFLEQLKNTKNYKFIGSFFNTKREQNVFIESINNHWPDIIDGILTENRFTFEQLKQYVISTFYYSSYENIKLLNKTDCLSDFISNSPTFLDIDNPDVEKLIEGLSLIDVKFTNLDYDISNKELFIAVYEKSLYQLSFELISLMLNEVYGLEKNIDFKHKNYSLILSKPDEPIVEYINKNLEVYIHIILDACEEKVTDDESAAVAILNYLDLDIAYKEKYIDYLKTVLEQLQDVEDSTLWSALLQNNLVKYSEANILHYFFQSEKGLDAFLVEFINGQDNLLNFKDLPIKNEKNGGVDFLDAVVYCNELSNAKYTNIIDSIHMYYDSFIKTNIQEDKFEILIQLEVISMNQENLSFIRDNYPDQLLLFINKNISTYTDIVANEENFNLDEMLSVLDLDVKDEYKINLLNMTDETVSIKSGKYSNAVKFHILNNKLDTNDIPILLNSYPKESNNVQNKIEEIAVKHISSIIDEEFSMSIELFSKLITLEQLSKDLKIELFALILPAMNKDECKEALKILQMKEYLRLLFKGGRPKFMISNTNKIILSTLYKKNWISSFDIDKDDEKYYRANGHIAKKDKQLPPNLL